MTCTFIGSASASVTDSVYRLGLGCYSKVPNGLKSIGGPMECANLIRTFLFPIIHPKPVHCS